MIGKSVDIRAVDADPWAAGWTMFHRRRQMKLFMHYLVMVSAGILAPLALFRTEVRK